MASKRYANPDKTRCVSCGACTKVCPKSAAVIWRGCHAKIDIESCVGCGLCERTCPASCIRLEERLA